MTTQSESDARRQDERERQTAFGPGGKPSWWRRNFGGGDSRSTPSPEAADAWNRSQAEYEASGRAAAQRNRPRLDSQTRTEAYDPGADMFDPRNMKPVDYQGRTIWTNDYSNLPANKPQPATKLSSSGAITKKISPLVAQPSDTYDVPPDAYSPNRGIQPQFSDNYDVPPDQQPAAPYVATRYSDEDYLPPAGPQTVASLPPYVLPSGVGMPYPPGTFDPRKPPAVTAGGPRFPLVGAGGASGGGGGGGGGGGPRWDQRYANWRNQKLEGANQWLENKLDALGRWNGKVFAQGGPVGYAEGGSTSDDDNDGSVYDVPEAPHGGTFMPVTAFGAKGRVSPSRAVTSQAPAATPFAVAKSSGDSGGDMFGGLTKMLGPMLGGMMGGGGDGVTPSGPLGTGEGGAYTTADSGAGGILGSLGGGMGGMDFGDIDMEIADWSGYAEGGRVPMSMGGMPWMGYLGDIAGGVKEFADGDQGMQESADTPYDPLANVWEGLEGDGREQWSENQRRFAAVGKPIGRAIGDWIVPGIGGTIGAEIGERGAGSLGAVFEGRWGDAFNSATQGTPLTFINLAHGGRVPYAQGGDTENPLDWGGGDDGSSFMPATAFGGASPNLSPSQAVIAQAPAAAPMAAPAGGGGGGGGGGMGDIMGMVGKLAPMAMMAFSDERLKDNIKPVGKTKNGLKVIQYNMKGSPRTQIGLSAQDVEKKRPSAVGNVGGFKTVDYGKALKASGGPINMMRGGYPELYTRAQRTAFSTGGGEHHVRPDGRGNGRSDHIDASLSPGEFVMDAETVSLAGDGDNDAGAREFEKLRKNLRAHKGKQLAKGKFSPKAKPVESYMSGKLSAADRAAHAGVSDGMRQMGRR